MSKYRPIAERIQDFKPVELFPQEDKLTCDLKKCQDCGVPFCHAAGCPLLNAVPEINQAVLSGRWETALATLLATSPFPEFTSRICPALCEGSCVQGMHEAPVPCRHVEMVVIERGFHHGMVRPRPPKTRRAESVAVIGSGPAGLAAAWRLNQAGFHVTVYEKDHKPGGFLRYGIPDFKLAKDVIDRRIALLEAEGIQFECGVDAGVDISGRLLEQRHQLMVLAVGARRKRDLPIPGRDLRGIHFATDYLAAQNRVCGQEAEAVDPMFNAAGKRVVVIGGGDTGSDCVGTAWRQKANSVTQIEIMPKPPVSRDPSNPWPQWPRTLRTSSSHEEGGDRRWSVTSTAFIPSTTDPASVGAINCTAVAWEHKDGRLTPVPVDGSEFTLQADLVLLAMGFTGAETGPLLESFGVDLDAMGRIAVEASGRISDRVYACGDSILGPSLVVRAISDALRVSESIIQDHAA